MKKDTTTPAPAKRKTNKTSAAAGTATMERHVVKAGDHWNVQKENAKRPSVSLDTQQAAIERANLIVERAGGGHVIIHKKDGSVRTKLTVKPAEK